MTASSPSMWRIVAMLQDDQGMLERLKPVNESGCARDRTICRVECRDCDPAATAPQVAPRHAAMPTGPQLPPGSEVTAQLWAVAAAAVAAAVC